LDAGKTKTRLGLRRPYGSEDLLPG
jgi:hypothetical protein